MLYLLLAILCSGLIAIIFKFSEDKNANRYTINTFNYITATIISVYMILQNDSIKSFFNVKWFHHLINERHNLLTSSTFQPEASMAWAVLIGMITGIIYFLGFYLYQHNVKVNGPGISATFMKLGIVVPITLSMIIFKDIPNQFQIAGILFALIGIVLINLSFKKGFFIKFDLVFLFIIGGMGDFNAVIYKNYGIETFETLFLFYIFFTALIISIIMLLLKDKTLRKEDILLGLLVGIPNQLTTVFLLKGLGQINPPVLYPIFSAGTILFVNFINVTLFKDKLTPKQIIGLIIIIVAIILLNIRYE